MKGKIFVLALFSMLSTECTSQKKTTEMQLPATSSKEVNATYPSEKPSNNVVRLLENQHLFLKDHKMNIAFNKVTEDSRCPINVRCVQAGHAKIEIVVMGTYTRPATFEVSTENNKNFFIFSGKKFTLENLYPSPSTDVGFTKLKGKYVADIKVEPTNQ